MVFAWSTFIRMGPYYVFIAIATVNWGVVKMSYWNAGPDGDDYEEEEDLYFD